MVNSTEQEIECQSMLHRIEKYYENCNCLLIFVIIINYSMYFLLNTTMLGNDAGLSIDVIVTNLILKKRLTFLLYVYYPYT